MIIAGYYVDTTGKNSEKIRQYIDNQLKQGRLGEQLGMVELDNLFTGSLYRYANARPYQHAWHVASNQGLCPHM